MSKHDPFDGIYDDDARASAPSHAETGDRRSEPPAGPQTPTEAPAGASTAAPAETRSPVDSSAGASPTGGAGGYSRTHLTRMRKAELQAIARERGVDASGDRDDLIARLSP